MHLFLGMEFHVLWQSTRQNRNNSFQYSLKELSEIDKVARSIFLFTSKLLLYFYWMKKIIFIPINLTVIIYMYMYCQSGVRCMYVLFLNYTNYIIKNHLKLSSWAWPILSHHITDGFKIYTQSTPFPISFPSPICVLVPVYVLYTL